MEVKATRDFVLWAGPRFRRSYDYPAQVLNMGLVQRAAPATKPALIRVENIGLPAGDVAPDREAPETACCLSGHFRAYH